MDDETAEMLEAAIRAALQKEEKTPWRFWLTLLIPVATAVGIFVAQVFLK
jgi:hypothetical protein